MRIEEKQDSEVMLKLPKIQCDVVIDHKIPYPLPKSSFSMLVCGVPGSGKSSLAVSLLTAKGMAKVYRKAFHHLYLVCPPHSRHSYKNDPFKNHDQGKVFDDLDMDAIETIEARLEETSLEDENSIIFIDDCGVALKDKHIQRALNRILANRRHLRCSIIIVAQSYRMIPLTTRKLCSHLLFFKAANAKERDIIHEEMLSHIDKEDWIKLYKYCFKDKHDHMLLESSSGKVWRNFNSIEITDS